MPTRQKAFARKPLALIVLLAFATALLLRAGGLRADGLSVYFSDNDLELYPGETVSVSAYFSSSPLEGIDAYLSSDISLDVVSNPAGGASIYSNQFVGDPLSEGELFTFTLTAPASGSGSVSVSAEGFGEGGDYSGSGSFRFTVVAEQPTSTETEAPTTTEREEETTTTEAPTETSAETSATETTSSAAARQQFTLKANGRDSVFVLTSASDAVPPPGFERAEGTFMGEGATLFTRAGSLPLVYGALSSDASPLFYLYDAAAEALYSFYENIELQAGGKTWIIQPITSPAPVEGLSYRVITINELPMSAYESPQGTSRYTLVYAGEAGQEGRDFYLYRAGEAMPLTLFTGAVPLVLSPTPTETSSLPTTAPTGAQGGGLDTLTLVFTVLLILLVAALAFLIYHNRARFAQFFAGRADEGAEDWDEDEDGEAEYEDEDEDGLEGR